MDQQIEYKVLREQEHTELGVRMLSLVQILQTPSALCRLVGKRCLDDHVLLAIMLPCQIFCVLLSFFCCVDYSRQSTEKYGKRCLQATSNRPFNKVWPSQFASFSHTF